MSYEVSKKTMTVTIHHCRITCNSCGCVAEHPGTLAWTVTNGVLYADGKCPACASDDIVGEDLEGESAIDVSSEKQDRELTLSALATYAKESHA